MMMKISSSSKEITKNKSLKINLNKMHFKTNKSIINYEYEDFFDRLIYR